MKAQLKDVAPRKSGTVTVEVKKNGNTLEITPEGIENAPVLLEFYDGILRLRVYDPSGTQLSMHVLPVAEYAEDADAYKARMDARVVSVPRLPTDPPFVGPATQNVIDHANGTLPSNAPAQEFEGRLQVAMDAALHPTTAQAAPNVNYEDYEDFEAI